MAAAASFSAKRETWVSKLGIAMPLTIVAFALRISGLDFQSLWNDELFSATAAGLPSIADVIRYCQGDVHPPGYFILLHLWVQLVGDSETMLRLPSAIAGAAVVPGMYFLGRLFGETTAQLAALLGCASYAGLYYSQEARPYIFLLAFATYFAFFAFGRMRSRREAAWFVFFGALLCYTHYFGVLLVGLAVLWLGIDLWRARPEIGATALKRLVVATAAITLLYLPWVPSMLAHMGKVAPWIPKPGPGALYELLRLLYAPFWPAVLVALVVSAFVLRRGAQDKEQVRHTNILLLWIAVPVVLAFGKSMVGQSIFYPKNLLIIAPAVWLLLARGCELLGGKRWMTAGSLVILFIFFTAVWKSGYYERPSKSQIREVSAHVARQGPTLPVLVRSTDDRNFSYYFKRFGVRGTFAVVPRFESKPLEELSLGEEFWMLRGEQRVPQDLVDSINRRYNVVEHKEFFEAEVWRFRRKP